MAINNSLNNITSLLNVGTNPQAATQSLPLTVGFNQNGSTGIVVSNSTAGVSSQVSIQASSDVGGIVMTAGSSTNSVARWTNRAEYGDGTSGAGVNLTTTTAAGDIRFYVQGNILAASINTSSVFTLSGTQSIASANATLLAFDNTVAHATTPLIDLYHDAATVATDPIYQLNFNGQNSTPAKKLFANILGSVAVNTAASEMGQLTLATINAGSSQNNIIVGNNLGQYRGTQTNTAAPSGFIGEVLTSTVAINAVNLSTLGTSQITSLPLTAGNWMVTGSVSFAGAGTISTLYAGINATTATLNTEGLDYNKINGISVVANNITCQGTVVFLSLSTTTTYYLNGGGIFTSTCTAGGTMQAVRIG